MVVIPNSFYIVFYLITIAVVFNGDAVLVHLVIPIGNRSIIILFGKFREERFRIFATRTMFQLGRKFLAAPKNLNFVIAVDM